MESLYPDIYWRRPTSLSLPRHVANIFRDANSAKNLTDYSSTQLSACPDRDVWSLALIARNYRAHIKGQLHKRMGKTSIFSLGNLIVSSCLYSTEKVCKAYYAVSVSRDSGVRCPVCVSVSLRTERYPLIIIRRFARLIGSLQNTESRFQIKELV